MTSGVSAKLPSPPRLRLIGRTSLAGGASGWQEPREVVRSRPVMPCWLAVITAAAAGVLMDLAYPAAGVWPAAYIATALVLLAMIGRSVAGSLAVGAVFGLVFYALLVFWTSRYLGPIPWIALSALEGLLTALGLIPIALAYRWLPRGIPRHLGRHVLLPALVAALWTGREVVLGTWPYGGLPWARLGMSQSESPVAAISSWVGVSGLSFLMVFAVAATVECARTRSWRQPAWVAVPASAVAILLLMPAFPTAAAGSLRIGAVQGNGPSGYFDERKPWGIVDAQAAATDPLYGEDLDLLVWPEGLDADPFRNEYLASYLTGISGRAGAPLLANAATTDGSALYNTSFVWDPSISPAPEREDLQTYDKRHPVPFGEYVPDRDFYNALAPDLVGLLQRDYAAGTDTPAVSIDGVQVGLAICFDVIYDEMIRESVRAGAQVLVFQTNNADFRGTDENLQQLAFARMRAIEAGRTVVNISTVGTSQIIRSDGATIRSLPAGVEGVMVENVELRTGTTPGVAFGTAISQLLLWAGLAALTAARFTARRRIRGR